MLLFLLVTIIVTAMIFLRAIKRAMKQQKLTTYELANLSGVRFQAIQDFIKERRKNLSLANLQSIFKALKIHEV